MKYKGHNNIGKSGEFYSPYHPPISCGMPLLVQWGWDKVSKSRDRRAHFTPSLVKECDFSDQQQSDLAQ